MSAVLKEVPVDYVRQRYLGGSDIAAVMGISPWGSRVSVWQKKTQADKPPEEGGFKKKILKRGHRWESVVQEMLVEKLEEQGHRVKVISSNRRYVDPLIPYFASEIDAEILLDDIPDPVNVELKTVHPYNVSEWGEEELTDHVPLHYAAQAMWGLGITGRKCCIVAPLFGADSINAYVVVREEETIAGMRSQAQTFWENYVIPKVAPAPIDLADVDRLFKISTDKQVIAEPFVIDLLMEYRAAAAQLNASEEQCALIEYRVKKFMAEAAALHLPGQDKAAVTWKTQVSKRLNTEAFKAAYPKVFKEFTKEGTSRVFRVNKFQLGGNE